MEKPARHEEPQLSIEKLGPKIEDLMSDFEDVLFRTSAYRLAGGPECWYPWRPDRRKAPLMFTVFGEQYAVRVSDTETNDGQNKRVFKITKHPLGTPDDEDPLYDYVSVKLVLTTRSIRNYEAQYDGVCIRVKLHRLGEAREEINNSLAFIRAKSLLKDLAFSPDDQAAAAKGVLEGEQKLLKEIFEGHKKPARNKPQ